MGIFGNIMDKIFGSSTANAAPAEGAKPAAPSTGQSVSTPQPNVDVTKMLDDKAGRAGQRLDWRRSIVDLMKLLDLDSSLTARKELARELNYTGDTNDSAAMNIWLHKQVMAKIAANGGKVPDELK